MYCLSWNSYKNNICNGFAQLQQREEFVDMTLVAEGHLVKVHKNLISLASPYIKSVIKSVPCTHPIIFLANITHEILCQLLEYVYTGEVCVELEKLAAFVKAAKELQLPGIANDLSHATSLSNKESSKAPEVIPIVKNIERENRLSNASIDSNINDALDTHTPSLQNVKNYEDLSQTNLSNANSAPETLPIKKIQIFDSREVNFGTCDAAIKTNEKDIILDIDMAASKNVNNMPHTTIMINGQSMNTPEALPSVKNVQIIDDRSVIVPETDDADNFDDFLKFPNQQNSTVIENNITQQSQKFEITYPTKSEANSLDPCTSIVQQQYTISNRGSLQMILNRYIYSVQYSANCGVKRRWRCIDYRLLHCNAYVDTLNDKITKRKNCHTHPYHDHKIMKKLKANLIFAALNTAIHKTKLN